MSANKKPSLFTVYYMNQEKVFETRMLLDNGLKIAGSEEKQAGTTNAASIGVETGSTLPSSRTSRQGSVGTTRLKNSRRSWILSNT